MSAHDSRRRVLLAVGVAFATLVAPSILASPASGQTVQTIPGIFGPEGVACPSSTLCLAVGLNYNSNVGETVSLDSATGQVASGQSVQTISGSAILEDVACASATLCLAVGENASDVGVAVPLDPATGEVLSGQSVQTIAGTEILEDVACASATLCVGAASSASGASLVVPLDPATGQVVSGQSVQTNPAGIDGLACSSGTLCLGVGMGGPTGLDGVAVPIDPTTGEVVSGESVQTVISPNGQLAGVACPAANVCLAVGVNYAADSYSGAAVSLDPTTGEVLSGQNVQDVSSFDELNGVACSSVALCWGVGGGGVAAPLDPATGEVLSGESIQSYPGNVLASVACASVTLCLAVGSNSTQGVAVPLNLGVAQSGFSGDLMGVACPSATLCLGVGYGDSGGVVVPLDPATGQVVSGQSVQTIAGTDEFRAVACPSATLCLAVGDNNSGLGIAVSIDPATGQVVSGQSVQTISGYDIPNGVACPSATLCLAVGEAAISVPLDPTTGQVVSGQSVQDISGINDFYGVACPSATLCLAVGDTTSDALGFGMVPLDPTTGQVLSGQSVQGVSETDVLDGVGCASATQCVGVGINSGGATLPLDPTTGGVSSGQSAQTISDTEVLEGAACPSAALCFAVGYNPDGAVTVPVDPNTGQVVSGGDVQTFLGGGGLSGVACASATLCLAVGFDGSGNTLAVSLTVSLAPLPPPLPPSGTTSSASGTCASADTTCNATNDGTTVTGTGFGSFTLAQYSGDPVAAPSFSSAGEYLDVQVASGSSFSSLTIEDCNLNGGTSLQWWNGSAWEAVSPESYSAGPPVCVTATLSSTSTPTISDLTGTVFGVALAASSTTTVATSLNPSTYGDSVTFTATVSPTDGGGTVAFYADGSVTPISDCGSAALSLVSGNYQATCVTAALNAGTHSISATYSGDSAYLTSTGGLSPQQSVQPAATSFSVTVNISSTSASVPYGTVATLAESGLPAGATGTVTFVSGSTTLCTINVPLMSCTTASTLAVGSYSNFSGAFNDIDGNYSSSKSTNRVSLSVTAATTGAPVAVADHYYTPIDTTLTVSAVAGVLANDTLNEASIVAHTNPAHGSLTLRTNGSFTYSPTRHFSGIDSFTYTIENSSGSSTAKVSIDVPARADLSVSLLAPETASLGSSFIYALTVANGGPDPAIGVICSLSVPAGVTVVSVSPHPSLELFGFFIWPAGTLAPGDSITYTVVVKVTARAHGTLSALALVDASGSTDPNLANNTAKATTRV
jgi:uncharacterized repeat protein (TIGR01451 family)